MPCIKTRSQYRFYFPCHDCNQDPICIDQKIFDPNEKIENCDVCQIHWCWEWDEMCINNKMDEFKSCICYSN